MNKEEEDLQLAMALSLSASEAKQPRSSSTSASMSEQEKAFFSNSPLEYKGGGTSSSGRVYGHRGAYHAMGSPTSSSKVSDSSSSSSSSVSLRELGAPNPGLSFP